MNEMADYAKACRTEVADWPMPMLLFVLGAVQDRLNQTSEAALCNQCLFIFPQQGIGETTIAFAVKGKLGDTPVAGEGAIRNLCPQCYRTALREALMAPLIEALSRGLDLRTLLGGVLGNEDPREPGQYIL